MRVARLFIEQRLAPRTEHEITGAPAQHLGRVLRARVGDAVVLFDDSGLEFAAQITSLDRHSVYVAIADAVDPGTESPLHTSLGLCLSKGDRFDRAIQKATELGVTAIQPLLSERVDFSIPADRIAKRLSHWQQIVISACEQSGRVRLPQISTPCPLRQWVSEIYAEQKWVLHTDTGQRQGESSAPGSIALLVGPEGGLTDDEVTAAQQSGFHTLSLGPRILRTETAPLVALSVLGARWGDIGG